jgi:HEAT repeat protein
MSHRSIALVVALSLSAAAPAVAQQPGPQSSAAELIRTLQGREFTEAVGAAERLGAYASQRAQVVPALLDALRHRGWASCSGDVRDAIARSLAQLKAKEAVGGCCLLAVTPADDLAGRAADPFCGSGVLGALPDRGGADGARRRLKDDNLAVRATAIYALGRIAGAAAAAELRAAGQDALAYETQLEAKRRSAGESEETLRQRYGLGVFDLRETLQQALTP